MHRPRIGIPLGLDDRGRWRPGRHYHYIDRSYADAVTDAGGSPRHLPIQSDPDSLVADIDGLLLPGGDDLPAHTQRGEREPGDIEMELVPAEQLAFDTALVRAAFRIGRPVLGICYGMQLLAREGGGRLILHLPSQRPEAEKHELPSEADRHPIAIEPCSRLARALDATSCSVNSLHHQAVAEVGPRHRIVAESPDGVIEAIEAADPNQPFELGVQWHPEKLESPESRSLFEHFIHACRERAIVEQDL